MSYRFHFNIPASVPNIAEISPERSLEKNLTVSVTSTKTLGLLMAISSFAWIFAGLQSTVKNFAAREQTTNWYLCQLNGCDFTNRRLRRTGSGANNITVRSHVSLNYGNVRRKCWLIRLNSIKSSVFIALPFLLMLNFKLQVRILQTPSDTSL